MILKDFIDTFNFLGRSAMIAVCEETGKVAGYNKLMKKMFPKIEIGVATLDMFENGTGTVIDGELGDGKFLMLINTPGFQGYAELSEIKMNFDDCGAVNITVVEPACEFNIKWAKFNAVFSALFSKNRDVILFLYLDKMEYEYVHIPNVDVDEMDISGLRPWKNTIEMLMSDYSDEENAAKIKDGLMPESIRKAYENGGQSYDVEYTVLVDGQDIKKHADVDFVIYSDEPIAVITVKNM